jgi:hypothetical protein
MSKKLELKKLGFALTEQMFDMNVDPSALYETNAIEMYRRAMIGEDSSRSKFKQIYGIKDRVKLGTVDFQNVVKPGACDFDPTDSDISQRTFEVCPIMIGTSFCIEDLETTFVSDQIGRGSKDFSEPTAFMNYFYETLQKVVDEELEILTWQGDTGLTSSYLQACDGLEVILGNTASGTLYPATASAVTISNVVDKLIEARTAVPKGVKNKPDFVYMVSTNVWEAYQDAISDNQASGQYFLGSQAPLNFQGTPIVKVDGASDDVIVAGQTSNFLYITDLLADTQGFNVVDFMKTALNRRIGVRTDAKVSWDVVRYDEVFFHKP